MKNLMVKVYGLLILLSLGLAFSLVDLKAAQADEPLITPFSQLVFDKIQESYKGLEMILHLEVSPLIRHGTRQQA